MKKKFFLLSMIGLLFIQPIWAAITDPSVDGQKGEGQNGGRPRTSQPSVEVSAEGDNLILDVSRFLGTVEIQIQSQGASYNTYINGYGSMSIDTSNYELGVHTFTITLSDGNTYTGTFTVI